MSITDLKKKIIKIGKKLYKKGLAPGSCGNISIKTNEGVLITASGTCLGELKEDDVILVNFDGKTIQGSSKPSSELLMHLNIYKERKDVFSIIHTHPPKLTTLSITGIPLKEPILAETYIHIGDVPVAEYETPSSIELANAVSDKLKTHNAVLMANHGVVVCGVDINETFYKLEALEFTAEVYILSKMIGNYNIIPSEKVKELEKIREVIHKTPV